MYNLFEYCGTLMMEIYIFIIVGAKNKQKKSHKKSYKIFIN